MPIIINAERPVQRVVVGQIHPRSPAARAWAKRVLRCRRCDTIEEEWEWFLSEYYSDGLSPWMCSFPLCDSCGYGDD